MTTTRKVIGGVTTEEKENLLFLKDLIDVGKLKPVIDRNYPLEQIAGAPILLIGYFSIMFSLIGQHALLAALFAIPVALFEFSLGIYLIAKGFKPSPVIAGM
jgi:hypothetical protein